MLKEPLGKEVPSLGMAKCPESDEERVRMRIILSLK